MAKKPDMLVRIRGLHFSRGRRKIFDGIDMDIPRGEITAIMGPSGTGKTTLLKLISAQLRPDAGSIEVDGAAAWRSGDARRRGFARAAPRSTAGCGACSP